MNDAPLPTDFEHDRRKNHTGTEYNNIRRIHLGIERAYSALSIKMIRHILSGTRSIRYNLDGWLYRAICEKAPLKQLRDAYRDKPMLVVGNGPSLNVTPLDDFSGIASIGMNKIDLLFNRVAWRPTIIVCANTLVARQHSDSFRDSDIPVFLSWKSRWFVRGHRRNVNFYNSLPEYRFSTSLLEGVGVGGTVTFDALQFAYHMGANPVILFGVDHSFSTSGIPADYVKRSGPDTNHFDPNYFQDGSYWGVPDLDRSEEAYVAAKNAFEADGRKIYDATIGGKLQVFEKIQLNEAKRLTDT